MHIVRQNTNKRDLAALHTASHSMPCSNSKRCANIH